MNNDPFTFRVTCGWLRDLEPFYTFIGVVLVTTGITLFPTRFNPVGTSCDHWGRRTRTQG